MTPNSQATRHAHLKAISTWLFVPATMIERVPKAFASGADAVIVDLEDAVAYTDKTAARLNIKSYCHQDDARAIWVRINNDSSEAFAKDIELCADLPNLAGIVLAKAEAVSGIEYIHHTLGCPVIALIESAFGLTQVATLAGARGLYAFSYGFLDLCQDLGVQVDTPAADMIANQIRYQLLIHSKVNQLAAPIDSIYPDFQDDAGLVARVELWSQMGLSGMLCIHPKQVAMVQKTLIPSAEQLDFAMRVVAEYERSEQAVYQIDGQMIDAPVIARCRQLLHRHASRHTGE